MAKYIARPNRWTTPNEEQGSLQNVGSSVLEVSSVASENTGIRVSPNQIISFNGVIYVRSLGTKDCMFTTVPFKVDGKGGEEVYTVGERKIGKWVDGSDLYQTTFYSKSPDVVGVAKVIHDTSNENINTIIYYYGVLKSDELCYNLNSCFSDKGRSGVETWYTYGQGFKMIVSNEHLLNLDVCITLRYTKGSRQEESK